MSTRRAHWADSVSFIRAKHRGAFLGFPAPLSQFSPVVLLCALSALASSSAFASPSCLKLKPFDLKQDAVSWSMAIKPGADCIQGLRWSYMQIYEVKVVEAPKSGKLVVVGSGFRYFADADAAKTADHFTIIVDGKNRRDVGSSTIEVTVAPETGDLTRVAESKPPAS